MTESVFGPEILNAMVELRNEIREIHATLNPARSPDDIMLTTAEVAARYKVSTREVLRWTDPAIYGSDVLPRYQYGKTLKFSPADVAAFVVRFRTTAPGNIVRFSKVRRAQ